MDEQRTPPAGRVVQTVSATRSTAIAATLLALLALGVLLTFARDRPDALFASAIGAAGWAGLMSVFQATRDTTPPLAIRPHELPQTVSQLTAVARGTAYLACIDAAAVAYSLPARNYLVCGMAFSAPIVIWDAFRRARRTERELGGTLWAPANSAWSSKGRHWFLVTEQEPFDEEL